MIRKLFLIINIIVFTIIMNQIQATAQESQVKNGDIRRTHQKNDVTLKFKILDIGHNKQLYYSYDDSTPVITLDIAFKNAGYALDQKDDFGLTYSLLYMFKQYELGQDPQKLKNIIEENGIKLDFSADQENFYISAKVIKQNLKTLVNVLNNFLSAKFYDQKILNQTKDNLLQNYKTNLGNAHFLANIKQQELLFEGSDLGNIPYGTKETHDNITLTKLSESIHYRFTKNNMIISVSGNITESKVKTVYDDLTEDLKSRSNLKYTSYKNNYTPKNQNYPLAKEQILIKAYFPSIAKNHNNFYQYYIANHIIGGSGLNSILSREVREKKGLTYSIYSYFDIYNDFSVWVCELSTDRNKYQEALQVLQSVFKEINENGFTEEEVVRAKKYLIGNFNIYFNENEKISSYLQDSMLRGVTPILIRNRNKIINSYSVEDINKTVKKFIVPENISYITIGELEEKDLKKDDELVDDKILDQDPGLVYEPSLAEKKS